jgi:hypothetical protein
VSAALKIEVGFVAAERTMKRMRGRKRRKEEEEGELAHAGPCEERQRAEN